MGLVTNGVIKSPPNHATMDPEWVEKQLDAQAIHNPHLKSLQDQYEKGHIFHSLVGLAQQQVLDGR
ncbi:hypothetical protein [Streptomyces sp. NPDC001250]|uniref:hypothetical protein n=1 Tax=unclassified Streptomyces TaxID=2593676 RepID=UPI0033208036